MLKLIIPETEQYDSEKNEFFTVKEQPIILEHSLLSLSKWEIKWEKPFLSNESKTTEQIFDYVKCMTVTPNINDNVYNGLTQEHFNMVNEYIERKMTATWFSEDKNKPRNREIITNEVIYYWMIVNNIPFDPCEKWHLNRLLTLIRVCNIKNNTNNKKMSKAEILAKNKELNALRRQQLKSRG